MQYNKVKITPYIIMLRDTILNMDTLEIRKNDVRFSTLACSLAFTNGEVLSSGISMNNYSYEVKGDDKYFNLMVYCQGTIVAKLCFFNNDLQKQFSYIVAPLDGTAEPKAMIQHGGMSIYDNDIFISGDFDKPFVMGLINICTVRVDDNQSQLVWKCYGGVYERPLSLMAPKITIIGRVVNGMPLININPNMESTNA